MVQLAALTTLAETEEEVIGVVTPKIPENTISHPQRENHLGLLQPPPGQHYFYHLNV